MGERRYSDSLTSRMTTMRALCRAPSLYGQLCRHGLDCSMGGKAVTPRPVR